MNIILASASERRKELLKRIVEDFSIIVSDFNENEVLFNGHCGFYVMDLAKGKALEVVRKLKESGNKDESIVIASDTIVFFNNKVLGKPVNKEDAFNMLKSLSGKIHQVYTGISVYNTIDGNLVKDYVCTDVKFSEIPDETIRKYIESGEPMDKAGAYGIQGYGGIFVEKINGCYYNVVGLPLNKLYSILKGMGVNL
ncbi:septum formation protein [Clostridium tetanomorphum]|uniref:dTTP/UTP pyrophosphatase n=1 Tax=Clostridium tetanomorphum TaxID=1553 RepID=A0A923E8Z2_CLOTT|nr:Maf-like protein [Clostridium tetanomorphum]KAJ53797.1 Maf-like protein [Clostridium tetanomorphum DSM 665]MBC2397311.1 Maf-like protein [Clostridium tetanomorphum]MBP1862530.1 septum formation protein [Clostridium tetanomorphum]NRS85629.1 septum formation protein [Clostridium tetanomorphum]NRZ96360.1 septum formation protein [Clostridium tetanomorphum]